MGVRTVLKKTWHFIWHEDSLLSWFVNLILAFVIVKWVIYPVIGLFLSTVYPIVAVVSGSMEHNGVDFDTWIEQNSWYEENNINKEIFMTYKFKNGFNKGDIMVLKGVKPKDIKTGGILVYESPYHSNPIIHRVVAIQKEEGYTFTTKGDNNNAPDKQKIKPEQIQRTGKAILRIPWLGWIKIGFVNLLGM